MCQRCFLQVRDALPLDAKNALLVFADVVLGGPKGVLTFDGLILLVTTASLQ